MLKSGIPFLADLLRLLVLLSFYLVLRALFFDAYATNDHDFWTLMGEGFWFDLPVVLCLSAPYLLLRLLFNEEEGKFHNLLKWIFIVPNILALLVNALDIHLYGFMEQRAAIMYAGFADLFPGAFKAIIVWLVMAILLSSAHRKIGLILYPEKSGVGPRLFWSAVVILCLYLGISNGGQAYSADQSMDIVTNAPYEIWHHTD